MFFGGNNGLNVFHPDSLQDNMHVPPIAITKIMIFDNEVKPTTGSSHVEYDHVAVL